MEDAMRDKKPGERTLYRRRSEDTVAVQGLRLLRSTAEALEKVRGDLGWSMRAVISAVLDSWAAGRRWTPPRAAAVLGGVVLALVVASGWAGVNCAHPQPAEQVGRAEPPPPVAQVEDPDMLPGETHTDGREQEQQGTPVRRGIPLKPGPNQKTAPCDAEMDEHLLNGACYARMSKKPPCGRLLEHAGACYRAVAKVKEVPVSLEPERAK